MLHVRCPHCGYVQTLSEERFLSISEDFLNCPHCNAKIPKDWSPQEEPVPDEARHKILAFSRRILSGRDVRLEVVCALESLVRHYGPQGEALKALGTGYALVAEYKKAEQFLVQSLKESEEDPEALRCLLRVQLAQKNFASAVETGLLLLRIEETNADDSDVAGLCMALTGAGRKDEAKALLDSHPRLSPKNAMVKQARRQVNGGSALGLLTLLGPRGPVRRFLNEARTRGLKTLSRTAGHLPSGSVTRGRERIARASSGQAENPGPPKSTAPRPSRRKALLEYWIYTCAQEIPKWESVRQALVGQLPDQEIRETLFEFLDRCTENESLTVEFIRKSDAVELFDYPDEMIPQNSRSVGEQDRRTVRDAQMIVRLRLTLSDFSGFDYLVALVRLAEAVRFLTSGVVQDAVSHTLWGTEAWERVVQTPWPDTVESHVRFEVLDEGDSVWLHTHGMQKFGLPELEMEHVPPAMASAARAMSMLAAQALIKLRGQKRDVRPHLVIAGTPFLLRLEARPRDEEAHFPAGSTNLIPQRASHDSARAESVGDVLEAFSAYMPSLSAYSTAPNQDQLMTERSAANEDYHRSLRRKLIDAHGKAKQDLTLFRNSFQQTRNGDDRVHAVKVGFPAQGGEYEWMWVSLDDWRGDFLHGSIENTPVLRKDLAKGGSVRISETEIFDWVIMRGQEVLDGAYTEQVLASDTAPVTT
jgi:uncharacterized protein YegJ (DUF2314 family)